MMWQKSQYWDVLMVVRIICKILKIKIWIIFVSIFVIKTTHRVIIVKLKESNALST